jgi:hypothetical protein
MSVASSSVSNNFTNYLPAYNLTIPVSGVVTLPLEAIGKFVVVRSLASGPGKIILPPYNDIPSVPLGAQVILNNFSSYTFQTTSPLDDYYGNAVVIGGTLTTLLYPNVTSDYTDISWIILNQQNFNS